LPASPESKNTSLRNQGAWPVFIWVPGSALKGRPGTTAEFFRILLGRSVPWLIAGGFALAAAVGAKAQTARPVEHFNYVLGTQTFGSSYHFTAAPSVVETAGAIAALGSNTIKFQLKPTAAGEQTLAEIARSDPVIKTVIDMPFTDLLMWVYPPATRARLFDSTTLGTEYSELYDLTRYLRQTYSGTGKSFFSAIGRWTITSPRTGRKRRLPSC
jgi:hypothetical protein